MSEFKVERCWDGDKQWVMCEGYWHSTRYPGDEPIIEPCPKAKAKLEAVAGMADPVAEVAALKREHEAWKRWKVEDPKSWKSWEPDFVEDGKAAHLVVDAIIEQARQAVEGGEKEDA